jgi:PhnB protein
MAADRQRRRFSFVTVVAPMLAVSDAAAAIEFYRIAFGAVERWRLGDGADIVAGLRIGDAEVYLATESPEHGARSPDRAGFTTVRIELFVDDPEAVWAQAVAAGGTSDDPVRRHEHETVGTAPIRAMLQGSVTDPFGHRWLIGRFLA